MDEGWGGAMGGFGTPDAEPSSWLIPGVAPTDQEESAELSALSDFDSPFGAPPVNDPAGANWADFPTMGGPLAANNGCEVANQYFRGPDGQYYPVVKVPCITALPSYNPQDLMDSSTGGVLGASALGMMGVGEGLQSVAPSVGSGVTWFFEQMGWGVGPEGFADFGGLSAAAEAGEPAASLTGIAGADLMAVGLALGIGVLLMSFYDAQGQVESFNQQYNSP